MTKLEFTLVSFLVNGEQCSHPEGPSWLMLDMYFGIKLITLCKFLFLACDFKHVTSSDFCNSKSNISIWAE